MKNRRRQAERRDFATKDNRSAKRDRRYCPDRRLNNIVAEWVPLSHVHIHPVTRLVFSRG